MQSKSETYKGKSSQMEKHPGILMILNHTFSANLVIQ